MEVNVKKSVCNFVDSVFVDGLTGVTSVRGGCAGGNVQECESGPDFAFRNFRDRRTEQVKFRQLAFHRIFVECIGQCHWVGMKNSCVSCLSATICDLCMPRVAIRCFLQIALEIFPQLRNAYLHSTF